MSFELNTIVLEKMGWCDKEIPASAGISHLALYSYSPDDPNEIWSVTRHFVCEQRQMIWAILKLSFQKKEIRLDPKLRDKKLYNFLVIDFSKKKPVYKTQELNSNTQLLKLVKDNLACDKSYQRYFQINSIIK